MNADQEAMTLDIAHRVLADSTASADRRDWARDIIAWLDFGDFEAAKRCGYEPPAPARICEGKAA